MSYLLQPYVTLKYMSMDDRPQSKIPPVLSRETQEMEIKIFSFQIII